MIKGLIFTLIASVFALGAVNADKISDNTQDISDIRVDVEGLKATDDSVWAAISSIQTSIAQDDDTVTDHCFGVPCYFDINAEGYVVGTPTKESEKILADLLIVESAILFETIKENCLIETQSGFCEHLAAITVSYITNDDEYFLEYADQDNLYYPLPSTYISK